MTPTNPPVAEAAPPVTPTGPLRASAAWLRSNDDAWDLVVATTSPMPYLQATPWAAVKARNGWRRTCVVVDTSGGLAGAQVLTRRIRPTRWSVAYAPRGPISRGLDADAVRAWTDAMRAFARQAGVSHVVIDPEIEAGGPELDWFLSAGWRRTASPQPARSRWVDLGVSEDVLWGGLRGKWRQYVQKARRGGIAIVEGGEDDLPAFYSTYVDTAERAGFTHRTLETYREVYRAFAAHDRARLLFARDASGTPVATLMLVGWGSRVVEPYGGMTAVGAESRANYLLKWEAIRSSRERGRAVYDMWGLSHPGIEQFKAGFGGREVQFVGGLELVTRPLVATVVKAAQAIRVLRERGRVERVARGRASGGAGVRTGDAAEGVDDPGRADPG